MLPRPQQLDGNLGVRVMGSGDDRGVDLRQHVAQVITDRELACLGGQATLDTELAIVLCCCRRVPRDGIDQCGEPERPVTDQCGDMAPARCRPAADDSQPPGIRDCSDHAGSFRSDNPLKQD